MALVLLLVKPTSPSTKIMLALIAATKIPTIGRPDESFGKSPVASAETIGMKSKTIEIVAMAARTDKEISRVALSANISKKIDQVKKHYVDCWIMLNIPHLFRHGGDLRWGALAGDSGSGASRAP